MNKSNTATTPSAKDISETLASDKDPPCPLAASSYLKAGTNTTITLSPKPGSGVDLSGLQDISITSLTGADFVASDILWDDSAITAAFDVELTAAHNEVYNVHMEYTGGSSADYTGVLTITEDDAPVGMFPHAMAGEDVIVELGAPVLLDGRASFHDDSEAFFSGTWLTDGGLGLFADYGEIVFSEVGIYTAALQIRDYYGLTSIDTITVTVVPEPGTIMLLGLGTLALRKRRA